MSDTRTNNDERVVDRREPKPADIPGQPGQVYRSEAERLTPPPPEPSLGELFSSLSDDFTTLLRQEIELAAAEIQENTKRAVRAATMVTAAGFLAYAGLIMLLIAAAILLGEVLNSMWMGAGIVGLVVLLIGGILYASGKSKLDDVNLMPRRAIKSVERDIEMAKEKLS
jgi:uncharacterized membrane protein YqjE